MASTALFLWKSVRTPALDEFDEVHRRIGTKGHGIQHARQQINQAYALLLSSQFQGYCRELHSECVDHIMTSIHSTSLRAVIRLNFVSQRSLDRGNPSPTNIGADFNRLGLTFWDDVVARDTKNKERQAQLESLNKWRNAIAHQSIDRHKLGASGVTLAMVREWRKACDVLANEFEDVVRQHLTALLGTSPW